jgi:hypothetical protein
MTDCYKCKFRREVVGSAHSACHLIDDEGERLKAAVLIQAGTHTAKGVEINPQGLRGGWATWPINFDPVWIKCEHFKAKDDE